VSETEFGTEVLTLVRDKALRSLSAGFTEGRNRWHTRSRVTRLTATLDHAALVRRGAYPTARLRAAQTQPRLLLPLARMRSQ
jgi:phage head maturation protease